MSEQQKNNLKEFQNTMTEIKSMREDQTTFYDIQLGSFGEENKNTKGITQYYGYGDLSCKGENKHLIMVSLNTDKSALTKKGELSHSGFHTLIHELKHCYQFYNKELIYIQSANGGDIKAYNSEDIEMAAFRRGAAFGSIDRYNPYLYQNLPKTKDEFINKYPGCTIIEHK